MSLPLLHAGKSAPGLSAALDLRFALDKSLTAYRGPTPSFSRASTGSYFDGNGVLQYAAVNILTYSEDFTNAAWVNQNTTESGNTIVSPDGKTTADSLIESATNSSHLIYQQANATSGSIYTFSVYLKANQRSFAYIQMADSSSPNKRFSALINISNGTIVTTRSLNSPTNTSSSISDAGNGWYRASITMSQSGGSIIYPQIAISDSSTPTYDAADLPTYSGNVSNGIYIWGAQLEASSTVGTYCPTTSSANSAPRFNHTYNGTSWVSRGLLVEEQRTNICLQSNTFNTTWLTLDGSVSANAATSPDGTNNAWKLNEGSGTTASHGIYQPLTIGTGNYTWSVYAKAGERSWLQFLAYSSSTNYFTWFNLANGTVGTNAAGTTASIQDVGGGWYRCSVSRSTSAGTSYAQIFAANADNNGSYAGDPTKGIYIYGCQVEAGSFPTSYTGTTSSAVTRSADVCQITGGDFLGFWNGTEGTVVAEFDVSSGYTSPDLTIANFYQSGSSWIGLRSIGSTSNNIFDCYSAGVQQARLGFSRSNPGISTRLAAAFKANDFAASQNGSAVSTDTSGSLPSPTYLELGTFTGFGEYLNGHIARLRYFNKRLPNATLQKLST